MTVSNRNISIDISLHQMVDQSKKASDAMHLTDKEKKFLSEETSKWLTALDTKKSEG